jgi:hypothetical protein
LGEDELGFNGSLIEVLRSTVVSGERKRIMLEGDSKEISLKLAKALQQEGVLKVT